MTRIVARRCTALSAFVLALGSCSTDGDLDGGGDGGNRPLSSSSNDGSMSLFDEPTRGAAGRGCAETRDCPGGQTCVNAQCVIGGECGGAAYDSERLTSNLMLVLDRSGSMDNETTSGGVRRWDALKTAVRSVLDRYEGQLQFGLMVYSSCVAGTPNSPGTVVFPVGLGNEPLIRDWLDRALSCRSDDTGGCLDEHSEAECIQDYFAVPGKVQDSLCVMCTANDGETSTGPTLMALVGQPSLQDAARTSAVLLLTDGAETTEEDDGPLAPEAAAALYNQVYPVRTHVVGLSDDVSPESLNATAEAGQTASNDGDIKYYQVNDEIELSDAFNSIANSLVSCSYRLTSPPSEADGGRVYVFFNRSAPPLNPDPVNGYSYEPAEGRLTFHGAACRMLEAREVSQLDVIYGCAEVVPTIY
jgi:hypothetical protein